LEPSAALPFFTSYRDSRPRLFNADSGGNYLVSCLLFAGYLSFMVRFLIEIEAGAGDSGAVNILLKTEKKQPTEVEETDAQRLLPALRDLLRKRFADGDESS